MKIKAYDGKQLGEREFDGSAFGDKVLYRTLKDAVVMVQANKRQGTVMTKTRAEVAGSGKKPWKQKHTGRARAGDKKSNIWRGGGTTFGPRPRDYSYHMPIKARRVALRSALSGKLQDQEVVLIDLSGFSEPSASAARGVLAGVGSPRRAVVVTTERSVPIWKSFRNFPGVLVRTAEELCAHDVVVSSLILVQDGALEALAGRVGLKTAAGGDQ